MRCEFLKPACIAYVLIFSCICFPANATTTFFLKAEDHSMRAFATVSLSVPLLPNTYVSPLT